MAAGWPAKTVECFTGDALHEEPPRKQLHSGRADLFEVFGRENGTEQQMHVSGHHAVVEPIARWRDFPTESSLPFEEFSASTRF